MKRVIFYLLFLLPAFSMATIVIPPSDMGQFAHDSEAIVYGTITEHFNGDSYQNVFQIITAIKGVKFNTKEIIIDEFGSKRGNWTNTVSGDTDFILGKKYLLFLYKKSNGHYSTRLMALGVFVQQEYKGKSIFLHEKALLGISFIDQGADISGLKGVYESNKLIKHLSQIVNKNSDWDNKLSGRIYSFEDNRVIESDKIQSREVLGACPNPKPDHCTVLSGGEDALTSTCDSGSPAKYQSNVWDVYVAGGAQEDPSTSTEITDLQNAVTRLDEMPGINATYQGVDPDFDAAAITCNSSIDDDRWNFGAGDNDIYVFFDDPCDEINDLSGCSGTLGRGGHWWFNSCHTDLCGNQWKRALRPYFVMNNGSGCVGADKYTAVLIHEMLHSMSLGHIDGTCTAIMNPYVCNSPAPSAPDYGVTDLDEQCTDWMYNITEAIPIELLNFDTELIDEEVKIQWSTASEVNNDFFEIEVSSDNKTWEVIANIKGAGTSKRVINYETYHKKLRIGTSYYRLKQVDFDGIATYSDISEIVFYQKDFISVSPNPFINTLSIEGYFTSEKNEIKIINISNKVFYSKTISKGQFKNELDLSALKNGIYFLKVYNNSKIKVFKIIKL